MTVRDLVPAWLHPSVFVKNGLIGGAGFVALKIVWLYFRSFAGHPELLAKMGPNLIFGILIIVGALVISNRLVDTISESSTRQAESAERQAAVAERMAGTQEAQREDGHQLAVAYSSIAAAVTTMATERGAREQENELLLNTFGYDLKRIANRLHAQDRALERIEDKLGINKSTATEETHDVDG